MVKFVPFNANKLTEELAVGGRIQEARIVTLPLRTEVHLVVRTATPTPATPENRFQRRVPVRYLKHPHPAATLLRGGGLPEQSLVYRQSAGKKKRRIP